jgi:hypothetical protein
VPAELARQADVDYWMCSLQRLLPRDHCSRRQQCAWCTDAKGNHTQRQSSPTEMPRRFLMWPAPGDRRILACPNDFPT